MANRQRISPHPLDGCDEDKLYETMMTERTVLVTAQREAQDNLIKTIIQLSSALIALSVGFITQTKFAITGTPLYLFSFSIVGLIAAIFFGMAENFFSSRAYKEQQTALEEYYGKFSDQISEPKSNRTVRQMQVSSFACFISALLLLGVFSLVEAKESVNVKQLATAPSATPTSAASAPTTSSSSSSATATATATANPASRSGGRQRLQLGDPICGAKYAATATEKGRLINNAECKDGRERP